MKYQIIKETDKPKSLYKRIIERIVFGKIIKIKFMRTDYFGFEVFNLIVNGKIHDLVQSQNMTAEFQCCMTLKCIYHINVPESEVIFQNFGLNTERKIKIYTIKEDNKNYSKLRISFRKWYYRNRIQIKFAYFHTQNRNKFYLMVVDGVIHKLEKDQRQYESMACVNFSKILWEKYRIELDHRSINFQKFKMHKLLTFD